MDFKAAIDALKKLDGGVDLASAIEAEVEQLKGKTFEVIGEKRTATTKATAYESALTAIAKALGLDGDIEAFLGSAEGKAKELVSSLTTAQAKIADSETRATTAESTVKGLERKDKLTQAASKSGAVAEVLEQLLGDKFSELAIGEDGAVKVGDKPLREYVEADPKMKHFIPALFPSQQTTQPSQPARVLPGGNPSRTEQKSATPVGSAISKMKFAVPGSSEP